ncbi:AAA family ATPase [Dysgonomonas sp. ZJ709]|uniref:AAA family ATPase n=1 Tax=Dysgonomonas sp. ZJ709 TaxID=2709797 RepID=UPI0013EC8A01|nr:AAA family ATPase [Dysgonomonas sp. ZJ709]
MWKLTEIYAQNICAFRELQYILQQGVTTLILGDNRDNESQRSNGSGKSALIECIALGITGSPLRKIKNEEIINDNSDECLIELTFANESNNEKFVIERKLFRKGSSEVACYIFRNGEFNADEAVQPSVDAYNKYILETLGITKDELYNNFILSKHKYQDFLSSSDKDKKEIINRFSNGSLVDRAIEEIVKDKIPITELQKKTELEFAGIEGRIGILTEQIEQEENSKEEKVRTKEEKITALNAKIADKRSYMREKADELGLLGTELVKIGEVDKLIQDLENSDSRLEDYLSGINKYIPLITKSNLTDWDAVIKAKKERINKAEEELERWDYAFAQAEKKVQEITTAYDILYKEYQEFVKDSNDRAETYDGELRRMEAGYVEVNNEIDALRKTRRALSAAIESLNNKLAGEIACPSCGFSFLVSDRSFDVEKGKAEVNEQEENYKLLSSKIDGNSQKLETFETEQNRLKNEKRHLSTQKNAWTDKIDDAQSSVKGASNEMEKIKRCQVQIAGDINQLNEEIDGILRKVFDEAFELVDEAYKLNERKQNALREETGAAESSIMTLESTIQEIRENTALDMLESLKKSLGDYQVQSCDLLSKKSKIELEIRTLERQEQNFIEFKTYLANTKIEALSMITNEFLESIGSDIRIKFSGFTVLKSGKVREKISVSLIRSGMDCGSFGKFSAGEAARVNLATILAMQKLINGNCGTDKGLDLLVLDEILEAVDEDGLAYMFAALNGLCITALVVSHGNISESYPHTIKITKENGESHIEDNRAF